MKNKKLLFLDDDENRHVEMKKRVPLAMDASTETIYVYTVEECIDALENKGPFDLVMLDHDLGGRVYVKEVIGTGTEVAEYIRDKLDKDKRPSSIIIHSWNPPGAKRMREILSGCVKNVVCVPF